MQGLFTYKRTYDRQGSVLDRLVRKKNDIRFFLKRWLDNVLLMSLCAIPNPCPDMQVSVLLVLLHQVATSNRMAGFCYTQVCKLTSRRFPSACSPQPFLTSTFSRVTATEFVTWNFCVIRVSLTLSRWCRCICRTWRSFFH